MPHIVRDIGWGTIDIVEHQSRVFFQQRWKYSWQETPPLNPWSLAADCQGNLIIFLISHVG